MSMNYEDKIKNNLVMTSELRWQLMYLQEGKCKICGIPEWKLKKKLHAHRIIKGKNGGKYQEDNLILVCPKCHYKLEHEGDHK